MFTGIIESLGVIKKINRNHSNIQFEITSNISHELKVDQSVAHNGICLTVIEVSNNSHTVEAIQETISITNIQHWNSGTFINLERCLPLHGRLDGHLVQGHVDTTAKCIAIEDQNGSSLITFQYDPKFASLIIQKGSITINGVSLTSLNPTTNTVQTAIIPFTMQHTNFNQLQVGDIVNLEFDLIAKYLSRYRELLDKK